MTSGSSSPTHQPSTSACPSGTEETSATTGSSSPSHQPSISAEPVTFATLMPIPHRERPTNTKPRKKHPSYEITSDECIAFVGERSKPVKRKQVNNAEETVSATNVSRQKTAETADKTVSKTTNIIQKKAQSAQKTKKRNKTQSRASDEAYPCKSCGFSYGDNEDPLTDEDWLICDGWMQAILARELYVSK